MRVRARGRLQRGLNEVSRPGSVQIVRYWRWAMFHCLSGIFGLVGVVLLLALDVRGYIARHEATMLPGLSVDQDLFVAWAMADLG